jgi:hypothetical protein
LRVEQEGALGDTTILQEVSALSGKKTTYQHFNEIFVCGWWHVFLKTEANDLLETFTNNATRAARKLESSR